MLTRMVDCVTWNFDNQIVVGNAGLAAQSTFRLQPPRFIQHIVFFFRTFRQGVEAFTYNTVTGGAGARFLTGVFNLDAVAQRNVKNGFTGLSFQNCAIRTKILMRQNTIFGMLNLVYGMAFQRATNRLVHAASGKFLGLFIYVFNGLFYGVNIIALCDRA